MEKSRTSIVKKSLVSGILVGNYKLKLLLIYCGLYLAAVLCASALKYLISYLQTIFCRSFPISTRYFSKKVRCSGKN
jgi:hypothetical protein